MKEFSKDGAVGLFGVAASAGSSWVAKIEPYLAFGSHVFGFIAAGLTAAILVVRLIKAIRERK